MEGLIIYAVCATLAGAGILCLYLRNWWRIRRITEQIEGFLMGKKTPLELSLREDSMATLENAVCDLEENVLRSQQREQEESRRTSSLTADISHQLKTPLTTLRLYTEMDEAPHMEESLQQITRMEKLVQSLLRLEKLCADGYKFQFAMASVEKIICWQRDYLHPLFPEREFCITGSVNIRCDEKWLGEAFLNLLKNACEHTKENGHIWITLEKSDTTCFCTIEDDGGGVPEKELPRLFERFYRSEHQNHQGVGIGMAIAKEIIRRHHGTITASNTKSGLKLWISLPIYDLNLAKV